MLVHKAQKSLNSIAMTTVHDAFHALVQTQCRCEAIGSRPEIEDRVVFGRS
jgi:hypothetical protein